MFSFLFSFFTSFRDGSDMVIPVTQWLVMNKTIKMHCWDITARPLSLLWKTGPSMSKLFIVSAKKRKWSTFISSSKHIRLSSHAGRFEQAYINSLLSASGANSSMYYWIGLMDQKRDEHGEEYSWISLNGSSPPLTFTNWNKHQPGDKLFKDNCLLIMSRLWLCFWGGGRGDVWKWIFLHVFWCSVSAGGCVAMSGGPALGRWEVKDCKSHKAMSVCEQSISSYHYVQLPEHHIDAYAPCPPGWESHSGLLHCFKVVLFSVWPPPKNSFFDCLYKDRITWIQIHCP